MLGILGDAKTSYHKWRFVMSFFQDFLQFVNDAAPFPCVTIWLADMSNILITNVIVNWITFYDKFWMKSFDTKKGKNVVKFGPRILSCKDFSSFICDGYDHKHLLQRTSYLFVANPKNMLCYVMLCYVMLCYSHLFSSKSN